MAIKGVKQRDVVSLYDPDKKAYRDVRVEDVVKQMMSLGFSEEEAKKKAADLVLKQHGPKED